MFKELKEEDLQIRIDALSKVLRLLDKAQTEFSREGVGDDNSNLLFRKLSYLTDDIADFRNRLVDKLENS